MTGGFLPRLWLGVGSLFGLFAVAGAALSAHALPGLDPARRSMVTSAVTMLGWHALALLGAALWAERHPSLRAHAAALCFALGSALFVAGVSSVALGHGRYGSVAPVGGVLLLLGWASLAAAAISRPREV